MSADGGTLLARPPRATDLWSRGYETEILLGRIATGLSSKALALYALGLNPDLIDAFGGPAEPRDPSDLRRCLLAWRAAPFTIQHLMTPVLAFWIDVVSDQWPNPQGTPEQLAEYYDLIEQVQVADEQSKTRLVEGEQP